MPQVIPTTDIENAAENNITVPDLSYPLGSIDPNTLVNERIRLVLIIYYIGIIAYGIYNLILFFKK